MIGEWIEPTSLRIRVYAEDIFVGNMLMTFAFKDKKIAIKMSKNAQFFFDNFTGFAYGEDRKEE